MKAKLYSDSAPKAIGPYSQGIRAGETVYVSGQLGVDPQTGILRDTVAEQTRQSIANLRAVLQEAGLTLADVVKTTVFLADMKDFAEMNGIYETLFNEGDYPARSCVQVAALPKGGLVEIECIAAGSTKERP